MRSLNAFNVFMSFLLFQVSGFKLGPSTSLRETSRFAKFEICQPLTINNSQLIITSEFLPFQ